MTLSPWTKRSSLSLRPASLALACDPRHQSLLCAPVPSSRQEAGSLNLTLGLSAQRALSQELRESPKGVPGSLSPERFSAGAETSHASSPRSSLGSGALGGLASRKGRQVRGHRKLGEESGGPPRCSERTGLAQPRNSPGEQARGAPQQQCSAAQPRAAAGGRWLFFLSLSLVVPLDTRGASLLERTKGVGHRDT